MKCVCIWTARQDPLEALLPEAATAAAAGYAHTLLLGESGAVWAVGSNQFGQLGLGREGGAAQPHPRLVRALRGAALRGTRPHGCFAWRGLQPALHATGPACGYPLPFHRFAMPCGCHSRALAAAHAAHALGCAQPCCSTADMRMHAAMLSRLACPVQPSSGRKEGARVSCKLMHGGHRSQRTPFQWQPLPATAGRLLAWGRVGGPACLQGLKAAHAASLL